MESHLSQPEVNEPIAFPFSTILRLGLQNLPLGLVLILYFLRPGKWNCLPHVRQPSRSFFMSIFGDPGRRFPTFTIKRRGILLSMPVESSNSPICLFWNNKGLAFARMPFFSQLVPLPCYCLDLGFFSSHRILNWKTEACEIAWYPLHSLQAFSPWTDSVGKERRCCQLHLWQGRTQKLLERKA